MTDAVYEIVYRFSYRPGEEKRFRLRLGEATVSLIPEPRRKPPGWTRLDREKCVVCPLDARRTPRCPIALNLARLVDEFKDEISHTRATVTVTTPDRTYTRETTLQKGLSSIFGLIMATSGCPVMDFFKPMARFHLPFATPAETVFRSVSTYLLRQFFEHKRGAEADFHLRKLHEQYRKVQEVNQGISRRLHTTGGKGEADTNAVAILDVICLFLAEDLDQNLGEIERLFRS